MMAKPEDLIVCVYCKDVAPRPARGEHVLMSGLHGRTTISDVCARCNSSLGRTVDEEFLRNSPVALWRLMEPTVQEGRVGKTQFAQTEYGYLDGALLNSQKFDLAAQAVLYEGKVLIICTEADQPRMGATLNTFRTQGAEGQCQLAVLDVPEHTPARMVMNRGNGKHLIRAATKDAADELLARLSMVEPYGTYSPIDLQTKVAPRISIDVNVPGRAAAKIAFNMAVYVFGARQMLSEDYDAIRRFILGQAVQRGPSQNDEGIAGVRLDTRFVNNWVEAVPEVPHGLGTSTHVVLLDDIHGVLCSRVNLFGGCQDLHVRLGNVPALGRERLPVFLVTSPDKERWAQLEHGTSWASGERRPWDAGEVLASGPP